MEDEVMVEGANEETPMATETPENETPMETAEETKPSASVAILGLLNKQRGSKHEELNEEALAELEEEFGMGVEIIDKLNDAFDTYPEVKNFLSCLVNGKSLRYAVNKCLDIEMLTPMEGDSDETEMTALKAEREKAKAEYDSYMEEVKNNEATSIEAVKEFAKVKELGEEQVMEFLDAVDQMVADIAKGKLTFDVLDNLHKGLIFDKEIENTETSAKEEGLIEGKNAVIEEKMKPKKMGSGLPDIEATRSTPTPSPAKKMGSQFSGLANKYKEGRQF